VPVRPDVERLHIYQDLAGGLLRVSSERDSILWEPVGQIGPQRAHDSQRESLAPAAGGACVQFMLPDARENVGGIEIVRNQDALELQLGASHGRFVVRRVIRRRIDCVAEHIDLSRTPGYAAYDDGGECDADQHHELQWAPAHHFSFRSSVPSGLRSRSWVKFRKELALAARSRSDA
jgi:hypothetical protein